MDKFNHRRPDTEQRRKLVLMLLIFAAVALWFAALFAFGNRGALWLLAIYGALVVSGCWLRLREEQSRRDLVWQSLPMQTLVQGPGFTPLEVAAIRLLSEMAGSSAALVERHFQNAQVGLRFNTGTGCLTTITTAAPQVVDDQVLAAIPWFKVNGLEASVGCRFWQTAGEIDLLEFFCEGERTTDLDWGSVTFSSLSAGPDRGIPQFRPVLNFGRLAELITNETDLASAEKTEV